MNIILHDFGKHLNFAPLTLTRPLGDLRVGIFTNAERWKELIPEASISFKTSTYLQNVFPLIKKEENLWWNASVIPTLEVLTYIQNLAKGESLFIDGTWVAYKGEELADGMQIEIPISSVIVLEERWNLFQYNDKILENDFLIKKRLKISADLPASCTLIGPREKLFIAPSAKLECAILNTNTGVIYLDEHSEIMEGSVVRGGLYLGEHAALKLATKIYGATTIGPHCKVGGEVNNVIFQAYSNKGHDGFVGNSVIGEWCNLGADTNTSNLKNNYGKVKAYDFESGSVKQTDVQFMGLMMGDHSKSGINTMFNTATVVGVSSTVFGAGFPPKYIPSFSWGGFDSNSKFNFEKAIEAANNMMVRRGLQLSKHEVEVLEHIFHSF